MGLEELQLQILMILKGTLPSLFFTLQNVELITTSDQEVRIISLEIRVTTPQHISFKKEKILVKQSRILELMYFHYT